MIAAAPPPGSTDPMTWGTVAAAALGLLILVAVIVVCVLGVELFTRAANRRRPDIVTSHTPASCSSGRGHAWPVSSACDPSQPERGTE